jgi:alpha-N-arabinofuranosidase
MKLPLLLLSALGATALAAEPTLTIDAGKAAAKSSPLLYGLMTEEINHCYDGGLYAELVQNRAFLDDANRPVHWAAIGGATIALDPKQPLNSAIRTSLRVEIPAGGGGVANDGYWGIPIQPDTRYRARFLAKAAPGFTGPLTIALESSDGATVYAKAEVPRLAANWQGYDLTLTTGKDAKPTTQARLVLTAAQPGTVWLGLVSFFPPTWKDRPNGLRRDLMQLLVDTKPAFLRFPGGNYLEGDTIETRFDWKKTLGPIPQRAGHHGPWKYRSTDGMGLLEFLTWCEDMGAEPVLAVYDGYSLNGSHVKPGDDLEPYVQDALDEIEYVTGPVSTKWGAQRAKDGHPAPFKLRYIEIGNEEFFDRSGTYDARYAQFADAIQKKHPQLACISAVGFEQPDRLRVHSRKPDLVDEHYYRSVDEFLKMSPGIYEKYDRNGPKIFVGEWAAYETGFPPWNKCSEQEPPTPNFRAAIGDAAFMAAMERNSDIVVMQCYAPLFVNVNPGARQWRPNLIGYDALRSYGSPSYYAFKMFSLSRGDEILKTAFTNTPLQGSVVRDSKSGAIFVKAVNPTSDVQPLKVDLRGGRALAPVASVMTLAAEPDATNTLDEPTKVVPVTSQVNVVAPAFDYTFPAHSISVIKLQAGR